MKASLLWSFGVVTSSVAFSAVGWAQEGNPPGARSSIFEQWTSSREFYSAVAVLLFGVLITLVSTVLIISRKATADEIVRLMALILIVSGVLFLVACGYQAEQIAPALGLLGTIAGYLLGRSERKASNGDERA